MYICIYTCIYIYIYIYISTPVNSQPIHSNASTSGTEVLRIH